MKTILVTGDHSPDYDIYLHSDEDNPPPEAPPTKLRATVGGAGLTERVLREVAQHDNGRAASLEVLFVAGEIAAAPPSTRRF